MESENQEKVDSRSKEKLFAFLRTVRRTSYEKYLQIMLLASMPEGVTMNGVAIELGEKPQTIHPLLKRAINGGAIVRERRGIEYCYFLSTDIREEDIKEQLRLIAQGSEISLFDLLKDVDQKPETAKAQEESQVVNVDTSKSIVKSDREESKPIKKLQSSEDPFPKLPGLPEYDPTWSQERQDRWFALYEKLLEVRKQQND